MKRLELYIHIPFCVRKCAYCDFLSGPADEKTIETYVNYLCEEIKTARQKGDGYEVATVFFGGGTPSLLSGEQMEKIMQTIRDTFTVSCQAEITMEMNPGTVTEEKLLFYKIAGINRLSIGLQSVHNGELQMLGRIHTYETFLETYQLARKIGFTNINIDLISAIPGQTVKSWEDTLKEVLMLNPEHISAYSLIVEEGTPFYDKYGENGICESELPSEEDERQMYWQTRKLMEQYGYHRYEISNYAKEGYECKHNIGYWERTPYLGFGIGAASFFEEKRWNNPEDVESWKLNLEVEVQSLSKEEQMEEFMFLGLRMMRGISKEKFAEMFEESVENIYGKQIDKLKDMKLLEEDEKRIRLTEQGIDVSNSVFVEFLF